MKKYIDILLYVIVFVMLGTIISLTSNLIDSKKEIERLGSNLYEYDDSISNLNLTVKEFEREVSKGNKEISRIDSILKKRNIKIKHLENYIATTIIISDPDTTLLPIENSIPVENSISIEDSIPVYPVPGILKFKTPFRDVRECTTIEGFVISTDSAPQTVITNRRVVVKVDNITVRRKWYQFWKPKTTQVITSDCGEVTVLNLKRK